MQAFFTSAMGHDVLMNVFEDDIVFPIRADWVLFDFYLKQKQNFQYGSSLKIPPSSSIMQKCGVDIQN